MPRAHSVNKRLQDLEKAVVFIFEVLGQMDVAVSQLGTKGTRKQKSSGGTKSVPGERCLARRGSAETSPLFPSDPPAEEQTQASGEPAASEL